MRKGMQREAAPRERVDFLTGEAENYKLGLGLMMLKNFRSRKSLFWILVAFEEGETQQIPSGIRSDCCHGI